MKRMHRSHIGLFVLVLLASWPGALAQGKKLPNVVILATGGTIAGAPASGTPAGYTSRAVALCA